MDPTVSAPNDARLEARRASIHAWVAPESRGNLDQAAGKLGLVRALLAAGVSSRTRPTRCGRWASCSATRWSSTSAAPSG